MLLITPTTCCLSPLIASPVHADQGAIRKDRAVPTPAEDTDRLLTVAEVAERCRVDPKTVRRWIATKELAAHKLGRVWRVSERDLRRFLSERWSG